MAQTFGQLVKFAQHASGVDNPGSGLDWESIVNESGRWMTGLRAWSYLRAPDAFLSIVANQDYIDLPNGYGRLLRLDCVDTLVNRTRWVAPEYISAARASGVLAGALPIYVAIGWSAPSTTAPVNQRVILYPTQGTATANAFRVQYLANWTELSGDGDFASIPEDGSMDTLLRQCVSAFAKGYLKEPEMSLDDRLDAILEGAVLRQAAVFDGLRQSNMGPMMGGAVNYTCISNVTFGERGAYFGGFGE